MMSSSTKTAVFFPDAAVINTISILDHSDSERDKSCLISSFFFIFISLREQSREVNMLIFICLALITDDAHNECIYIYIHERYGKKE